jgi:16S rRNA processing protein RimM
MGRVVAPYGVRGWIKVQTLTETVDGLLGYASWWIDQSGSWSNRRLLEGRVHGNGLVARIEGVADRAEAANMRGASIAVLRSELPVPPSGQYYWADLVGLAVVNQQGESLGQVAEIFSTGAHDVVVVRGDRERLIPFVESVLREVDLQGARLVVDWGLDY